MIKFDKILYGKFIFRENRFIGRGVFSGKELIFHIADTGRMKELLFEGNDVLIYKRDKPGKTKYSLLGLKNTKRERILINSAIHSALVVKYLEKQNIKFQKEVTIGDSRLDFFLDNKTYVEVKGCSLAIEDLGLFPDAPTSRGTKHVNELIRLKNEGKLSEIWFLVTNKIKKFRPNTETDPIFSQAFYKFLNLGGKVKFLYVNFDNRDDSVILSLEKTSISVLTLE